MRTGPAAARLRCRMNRNGSTVRSPIDDSAGDGYRPEPTELQPRNTVNMKLICALLFVAALGTSFIPAREQTAPSEARYDPVVQNLHGWTVYVDPTLVEGEHAAEGQRALSMLANHLERISLLVTGEPLIALRKLELWIERANPDLNNMAYHPSRGWLEQRGHDPRLANKVHISHASELVSRSQLLKHPAVILHELAHSYHDQVLGFDEERIMAAYEAMQQAGTYEKVLDHRGREVRHYGLNDQKEYFAESTEAYFYRNDFYPFVAAELMQHDPGMFAVLSEVWGPLGI